MRCGRPLSGFHQAFLIQGCLAWPVNAGCHGHGTGQRADSLLNNNKPLIRTNHSCERFRFDTEERSVTGDLLRRDSAMRQQFTTFITAVFVIVYPPRVDARITVLNYQHFRFIPANAEWLHLHAHGDYNINIQLGTSSRSRSRALASPPNTRIGVSGTAFQPPHGRDAFCQSIC